MEVTLVIAAALVEFSALALQTVGYQKVRKQVNACTLNYLEVPFSFFLQAVFFGIPQETNLLIVLAGAACVLLTGAIAWYHDTADDKDNPQDCLAAADRH